MGLWASLSTFGYCRVYRVNCLLRTFFSITFFSIPIREAVAPGPLLQSSNEQLHKHMEDCVVVAVLQVQEGLIGSVTCVCVCVCVWDIGGRGGGRLEWLMSAVRKCDTLLWYMHIVTTQCCM